MVTTSLCVNRYWLRAKNTRKGSVALKNGEGRILNNEKKFKDKGAIGYKNILPSLGKSLIYFKKKCLKYSDELFLLGDLCFGVGRTLRYLCGRRRDMTNSRPV